MRLPGYVLGAIGVLLVGGLVQSAAPAAVPRMTQTEADSQSSTSCADEGGTGAVRAPRFVRQIATGETGWFSSPGLVDLDGDGRLEIVAPFYSTFVFDANGHLLGRGTRERGPGLRAVGGRPISRATASPTSSSAATRARWRRTSSAAAGCSSRRAGRRRRQRRPVAGGARARRGRPERRRSGRGRGDDDEHVAHGCAGVRLRRDAAAVPARGRPHPAWPRYNKLRGRATTCGSTGSATTATARTARTSASATSTTTPTWRSSPPSTTTRSTRSTSTAPRSSRRRGSPTRSPSARGPADGLGPVHPVGRPPGRAPPLPPAQGRVAEPGPPALAAVDRVAAVGGRPGR